MSLYINITWQPRFNFLLRTFVLLIIACRAHGQDTHPHILVKPGDKAAVLAKISEQAWAKNIFNEMVKALSPYVERHKSDPQWILSRYLMNRAAGKYYTQFFSDPDGTELVRYAGNAPFPTVRVSSHKRPPITKDGYSYKSPSIEELVPNDTSMKMLLQSNAPGGGKELVNPQTFVEGINGRINELALKAAVLYWLTGNTEYAVFAADILNQWARGASYQSPVEGPCRTGFLSIQTLGDGHYEPMPLAYDFLYDFLRQHKYETSWYEGVFGKIAHTMTFRGYWNNNWFAAQAPAMIFSALSLEDKKLRDHYITFYLDRDTVNGTCGHLAIPSVVKQWLTPDGHWKEPGGYHNFPVSSLLVSALALENNGYAVFEKNPTLLQASYVLLKYSFPNFIAPSIGDTGPVSQNPDCLEIGILMAKKYGNDMLSQLTAAMDLLMKDKGYKRESSDYMGLLCYSPQIPQSNTGYTWPRSGELDFAKCYLQRNGTDREKGLMYVVQGATYNHNHANGMSMELYGNGNVMGVDPGKGITYEAPMHVNYYAQWAAHNTVVAGAVSGSVPHFTGGGGTKQMGEIKLQAMEPRAEREAVSPYCSFTDTRYTDKSTKAEQQRTMGIIRTSGESGYYIDIYRSSHPVSNEYIYHNIGHDLQLLNAGRKPMGVTAKAFPISKVPFDPPGFREIRDYKSTGMVKENVVALFGLKHAGTPKYMQVLFTGEQGREFFTGKAPASGTADAEFRQLPTPTLISRQEGEAWKRPFIAVYEPFAGDGNFKVRRVEPEDRSQPGSFTAINVLNKDQSRQIVFQALSNEQVYEKNNWRFKGSFGVISLIKDEPVYLYLGEGNEISYREFALKVNGGGSANLDISGDSFKISCNQQTEIHLPPANIRNVMVVSATGKTQIPVVKTKNGISFTVPSLRNAEISLK